MCNKVYIRPIELCDTDNIVKWRNQKEVKKFLYNQSTLTAEQHIEYFNRVVSSGKCVQFIIEIENKGIKTDIGTAFIKNIDSNSKNGEYGIFIGEESARGKGYAVDATRLVLRFGFANLKLHRIYLTVMSDNIPAIKTYKKCGFCLEGLMRDEYLRYDGYVDVVLMGILENEWVELDKNYRQITMGECT